MSSKSLRWRPEDLLLTWLVPMSWEELAADSDDRALEAYRALELSVRLQDAFEAPKLRDLTPRLGQETILKLLAYAWVRYTKREGKEAVLPAQLRQWAQFLLDSYPLESIKDIIYAFRRIGAQYDTPREVMTEYLEWKSQKLEEWHRSYKDSPDTLPDWILAHCPPHWFENNKRNEATQNRRTTNDTDQAA
ncbi:hypothetical protein [Telluribacter sp.]|uniref:hypothetical protein n=1 Tax=Telluribacter sp. TaxID=1978767 RepID=UPI002E14209E